MDEIVRKSFGGLGGSPAPINFEEYIEDDFAQSLNKVMGDLIREDLEYAYEMWGALANVDWERKNEDGSVDIASYSFRAAGDLIASIRSDGTSYMDYYCSSTDGIVPQYIAQALEEEGWKQRI